MAPVIDFTGPGTLRLSFRYAFHGPTHSLRNALYARTRILPVPFALVKAIVGLCPAQAEQANACLAPRSRGGAGPRDRRGRQRDCSFRRQKEEGECLLKVQPHHSSVWLK